MMLLRILDVYKAADVKGVVVVGGNSWSVGAAGGWILGGGHSALSPQYGLGVDSKWGSIHEHPRGLCLNWMTL
jgi:hypothetical protein